MLFDDPTVSAQESFFRFITAPFRLLRAIGIYLVGFVVCFIFVNVRVQSHLADLAPALADKLRIASTLTRKR
jgi:hypothetical protein